MLCTYQDMLCTYQDILQTPSVAAPLNGLTCLTAFRGCFLKFTFLISTILLFSSSSASRRITAKLGSSEVLHCNISERILQDFSSEHMLEWRKRSRELPIFITFNGYPPHVDEEYQGRLQLVGVSSLLLSNIQAGDEGWYNCFVVFIEKSRDVDDIVNGSWTYLSLQVPPTLIKSSPSFVTGRVGETLELHCDASGAPQPIISWHKNGKELPTVPLISVHHNNNNNHLDNHLERAMLQRTNVLQHHPPSGLSIRNSARQSRTVWSNSVGVEFASSEVRRMIMYDYNLQIPNLEKSDSGLYTCTLTNAAGHAQHMIRLIVEDSNWTYSGSAYITVPPNNQTSMEGTRVKLSCHAEGSPNTITYNWYKDNISVQSLPSLMSRSGLYADGSLVIKLLLKEDMGWYKCMTFNGVGQPAEATAFLNVTYLPRVIASSQEKMQLKKYYLARGLTGRIDCPVDANPPASVIMWSKNDRFIVPSNNQRLRISKHGMLIIRDIDSRDEGFYSCLPYSPLGKGNKSESFQVHVREAPHFSVRPDVFYQRRTGDSVFMPCLATGDPAPNIRWQKVDGPFPPSTKTMLNDGNLTIAKLDHSDAGLYECLGLSPVITIIASSYLIIGSFDGLTIYPANLKTYLWELHFMIQN